jgi:hypothetical protein
MALKDLSSSQAAGADRLLEHAFPDARQASRRSVLRHALTLFNANGVEATTIDDLKRASGQSVGTIYHHFKNKEGVVGARPSTTRAARSPNASRHWWTATPWSTR